MIRTEHGFFTGRMNQRGGYSLLEVILATAILAGSSLMLATLISNGANLGNRAQERAEALLIAQTLIDETLATRHGESFEEEEPFSESSLWSYRLRAETQEDLGVIVVTAEVFPLDDEGGVSSAVSYKHLLAHETNVDRGCRLLRD